MELQHGDVLKNYVNVSALEITINESIAKYVEWYMTFYNYK